MRKTICTLFAFWIAASPVWGGPVRFGLKGGINFSDMAGRDTLSGSKTGFTGGGFMEIRLFDFLSLQPEAYYSMKGMDATDGGYLFPPMAGSPPVTMTARFNYLETPVLLKINFHSRYGPQYSLFGGPYFAYLLSASDGLSTPGSGRITSIQDVTATSQPLDQGWTFGACVEFGRFLVDVRYDLGETSVDNSSNSLDIRNRGFSGMMGYLF